MPGFWEKALSYLGLVEEVEEDVYDRKETARSHNKRSNVLSLKDQQQARDGDIRVIIARPVSFEESQQIAGHLKCRKPVFVNLEETENAEAKRIVDFVSGATYALGGEVQKVSQNIFLFAPPHVEISAEVFQAAATEACEERR